MAPGLTDGATARFHRTMVVGAVLFDYGGTLDGEASHWLDRFVELYAEAGVSPPFDQLKTAFYAADEAAHEEPHIVGASLRELMDFHVGVQLGVLAIDDRSLHRRLVESFLSRSEQALSASRALLEDLAGRFRLGVVSNFYGNVARILDESGIASLLSVIADSSVVGFSKPDVRIFLHAVAALGAAPAEVLHVGDSYERDVCGANAAGLRTAWLVGPNTRAPVEEDCVADLQVRSLKELAAVLERERR